MGEEEEEGVMAEEHGGPQPPQFTKKKQISFSYVFQKYILYI